MNREIGQATEENEVAKRVYSTYHGLIIHAVKQCVGQYKFCHIFDIHGQQHRPELELGYLLVPDDLDQDDNFLDNNTDLQKKSSLAGLVSLWQNRKEEERKLFSFSRLLRGDLSLGACLWKFGIKSVPSPILPRPENPRFPYFSGAFTTRNYSRTVPPNHFPQVLNLQKEPQNDAHEQSLWKYVSVTQIEPPIEVRKDEPLMTQFVESLSKAIVLFLNTHYFFPSGSKENLVYERMNGMVESHSDGKP